jgi:ABC-type bacteriocin/lantibiotic exporter with double-glycine peptidase domain
MYQAEKFLKAFHKTSIYIKQLRNTFDNIKTMKNEDNLSKLVFKNGNFLIQNLSFSYSKNIVFQKFSLKIK